METLAMDGSTLPALKDLFPEHFFEHPEHAMNPPAILPQLPNAMPQLLHPQQQQRTEVQQQEMQITSNGEYAQQFPSVHSRGRGGRRATKRSYDAAHAHGGPQPQDPYVFSMGPSGPIHPLPSSTDVHLHLPGTAQLHVQDEGVDEGEGEDDGDGNGPDDGEKRRHACPRCGKRFNRPSSLKIHLNTHTGAKPYACPFQGCGRTFNVSSNMRRHFRNHARRPPPPPLPPNNVYPIPISAYHLGQRGRGRPAQHNPNPQDQSLSLSMTYDNETGFGDPHDHATQLYPRSSDVRNSRNGRGKKVEGAGALMTPPYTNEGDEYDQDGQNERNLYSQIAPYGAFGPGPGHADPNSIFGGPQMSGQQGMTGMQVPMGMPGMGVGPFEIFPVDPALTAGHSGNDADADGETDADGEFDPDLDAEGNADAQRERDGNEGEMRRLGPSTSNARASPDPKADLSPRRQRTKLVGANGMANITVPVPASNGRSAPTSSTNGMGGVQFRQILVPVPVSAVGDPAQVAQYAEQYQAHYSQQLQQYQQQQQMFTSDGMNGMNGIHGVGGAPNGSPFPPQMQPGHGSYSNGMSHALYLNQQQPQAQFTQRKGRSAKSHADGNGNGKDTFQQSSNTSMQAQPQSNAKTPRRAGKRKISGGSPGGVSDADGEGAVPNVTPGAAPAPPYKLYTYPPPEFPDGEEGHEAAIDTALFGQGGDPGADEDGESNDNIEDDNDDGNYTGKATPKKGRDPKRGGATQGRPRGRPRGSGKGRVRGRGRPRKSIASAVREDTESDHAGDAKADVDADLQQAERESGREARKRQRVSAGEEV